MITIRRISTQKKINLSLWNSAILKENLISAMKLKPYILKILEINKNGKYIGIIAPYGYIKDENDCHKFVLDKK